eukprot:m.18860 g.18860  ORF g.18860 m.18860 type:complete len:491 (+) comp27740_c0_seq3:297-1769(+)
MNGLDEAASTEHVNLRLKDGLPCRIKARRLSGPPSAQLRAANQNRMFEELSLLKDTPRHEQEGLFVKKLHLCSGIFEYTGPDEPENLLQRACLTELCEYVSKNRGILSEVVCKEVIAMVATNIFWPLPRSERQADFDPDEDEPLFNEAWSHLQLVYDFFLLFLESPEFQPALAKKYLDQKFLLQLLERYDSEDPRERDYLKTILHRVYGKCLSLRSYTRKQIKHIFLRFVYEKENFNGMAELLEILGSIINGFAIPIKEEHKQCLLKVLIPLHKPSSLARYHSQLTYCVVQYIGKEPPLALPVIMGLIKYWPKTNSGKEVLFLGELEEVLEVTKPKEFGSIQETLFKQLARCVSSTHFQVAERALLLWKNDYVMELIEDNLEVILPILFKALYQISKNHWHKSIITLVYEALKTFTNMNNELFEGLTASYKAECQKEIRKERERQKLWCGIELLGQKRLNTLRETSSTDSSRSSDSDRSADSFSSSISEV